MLRVKQVAEKLGISAALVYELVSEGLLSSYRIGIGRGAIRFKDEDVNIYLEACRVEGEMKNHGKETESIGADTATAAVARSDAGDPSPAD